MTDLEKALSITGKFEGHDLFSNLSDDFDGMGLSAGVLQWNFGMGSLQTKILATYMKQFHDIDKLFPEPIAHLVARGTNAQDVVWVRDHMLTPEGHINRDWTIAWRKFMLKPEVVAIQMEACKDVAKRARDMQTVLGMTGQRSFCWAFDIITQNGSLKGLTPDGPDRGRATSNAGESTANHWLWKKAIETVSDQQIVLFNLSFERANIANPRWFQDVFDRKGTIALGVGRVHGEPMNLTFQL